MRELTSHKGGVLNDALAIVALGEPCVGGACASYEVSHATTPPFDGFGTRLRYPLWFHTGDPSEGIKGISNEALLAIVEDRLAGFQAGPFACAANEAARSFVRMALDALRVRTQERRARGVEGKATP